MLMTARRAKEFDKYYWLSDPLFAAWIADHLAPYGQSVCDVGAGTGAMVPALSKSFTRVDLVEPSSEMLQILRRNLADSRQIIRVHDAPGENLPLANNEVDVALFKSSLHHCVDVKLCVREMARVARSAIALVEVISPDPICTEFARELVLRKEVGRSPDTLFTEETLIDFVSPYSVECRVLHFDQYIDLNVWLQYGDLTETENQALLDLAGSQSGDVRAKMQIHFRSDHLMQLRRMALVIGVIR
jgi:ubiquinone/menaquinone biosynthesis C-methylase UbiE